MGRSHPVSVAEKAAGTSANRPPDLLAASYEDIAAAAYIGIRELLICVGSSGDMAASLTARASPKYYRAKSGGIAVRGRR